jgi:cytochrome c peroxidase
MRYLIIFFIYIYSFAENITPIPLYVDDVNIEKVRLGKKLFFDPILSKDGTVACAGCHLLDDGGDDNQKVSYGIKGKTGTRNSPTVLNSRYNFVQFWDGRAENLEDQAKGPIENPVEMGNNFPNLIKTLNSSKYKNEFEKIYKDGISKKNIVNALAEYEKTLITPNSSFDKYLRGNKDAITSEQKRGYELFKKEGCIACHNGVNIGGNLYSKSGFFKPIKSDDLGRYYITQNKEDKHFFKVPTLRNIEKTAPYLHDGRFDKLKDVVESMISYQLGKKKNSTDVKSIVEFLKSLNGELVNFEKN